MSKINDKLGLKPAGKRSMMKLPDDAALRNQLTSARCPACHRFGANLSRLKATLGWFTCSWCAATWNPEDIFGSHP